MSRLLSVKVISILSMSSLVATAYILIFIPTARSDEGRIEQPRTQPQLRASPVQKYIGYLNGTLSILIAFNAIGFKGKRGVHEGFWLLCILPLGESPLNQTEVIELTVRWSRSRSLY